jgi:hypothetical protein
VDPHRRPLRARRRRVLHLLRPRRRHAQGRRDLGVAVRGRVGARGPALRASGARRILDLCSGGGGPLPSLRRALARDHGLDLPARLSDLHPNLGAFARIAAQEDGRVEFAATPVDATAVPVEEAGFRTMFGCFHHFRPPQAAAILRDAWAQRRGLGIFEVSERSLAGLAGMTLAPLSTWLLTPMIRPRTWQRLALTYVVPVIPALYFFDGVVSQLRTYTPDELRELTAPLQRDDYAWDIGQLRHPRLPGRLTYLLGVPR